MVLGPRVKGNTPVKGTVEVVAVDMVHTVHTALVEVHGNSGSYFTAAKAFTVAQMPQARILDANYAGGQRCRHGNLLVRVTYALAGEAAARAAEAHTL
jgi:hypothetical protein